MESESAGQPASYPSQQQREMVISTWRVVNQAGVECIEQFFTRLFELHPEIKPAFISGLSPPPDFYLPTLCEPVSYIVSSDMALHQRKMFILLNFLMDNLNKPEIVQTTLEALARRHIGYKVKLSWYPYAGTIPNPIKLPTLCSDHSSNIPCLNSTEESLLWVVDHHMGDHFSAEVKEAWISFCFFMHSTITTSTHQYIQSHGGNPFDLFFAILNILSLTH